MWAILRKCALLIYFSHPDVTVETFWFGDEIEYDVPVNVEDLEYYFNNVYASLNSVDADDLQRLPEGFQIEECLTKLPVTAVEEHFNFVIRDLLSNNLLYCKTFWLTLF